MLLHGFLETHRLWDALISDLSKSYHLLIPDLPGFGDSTLSTEQFTLDEIADKIVEHIRDLTDHQVTVIGHSLGGYITLSMAKKYPELVKKAGLFHSTSFADDLEKKATRNKTIDFINTNGLDSFIDNFFKNLIFPPNLSNDRIAKILSDMESRAKLTHTRFVNAYIAAMRDRPDLSEWLRAYNKPFLFIAGTEDLAVPIEKSRLQSNLNKHLNYFEIQDVSHCGMIEDPSRSLEILRGFLAL